MDRRGAETARRETAVTLRRDGSPHLRSGIRDKILAGHLPKQNCRMTWYGPGTGGICVACEQPIVANDLEVECDLPKGLRSVSIGRATTSGQRSAPRTLPGMDSQVDPSRLDAKRG
jgi:hypothetical protein